MDKDPLEKVRRYVSEGEVRLQRQAALVEEQIRQGLPWIAARSKRMLEAMEQAQAMRRQWLATEEAYMLQQQSVMSSVNETQAPFMDPVTR
jgi:ADP-glucose pyrophosphorylase